MFGVLNQNVKNWDENFIQMGVKPKILSSRVQCFQL